MKENDTRNHERKHVRKPIGSSLSIFWIYREENEKC